MSLEASRIIFNLPTPPKKAYFSFRYGKSCGDLAAIVLEGIRLVWAWVRSNIISPRHINSHKGTKLPSAKSQNKCPNHINSQKGT